VRQIEKATGHPAELGAFHFDPWRLEVTIGDLTVHGREPAGTPPLFHVRRLAVGVRVDSLWGRKISLGSVDVLEPAVHVRIAEDGSSNLPVLSARAPAGKPLRERLFDLIVRRLRIEDGYVLFNDVKIPLVAEGGHFELDVDYSDAQGKRAYLGRMQWQQMQFVAKRYLPAPIDVATRFTLEPDSLAVTQLVVTAPHSSVDSEITLTDFARPQWDFRYRGRLDLGDIRTILRKPSAPTGSVDFSGEGRFGEGQLALNGQYAADAIALGFQWFHSAGITSRGTYHADRRALNVPDFSARALGGNFTGRVDLDFKGLAFSVNAHAQAVDLATLLAAVNNPSFPVNPLHWAGTVDVEALTSWNADFKNLDSRGVTVWVPPAKLKPGEIPATAHIDYHYSMASRDVALQNGEISTPASLLQMNGVLGDRNSALQAVFDTQDLIQWDDFINRIRGPNTPPRVISGRFHWEGSLSGRLAGPTFAGHVQGTDAHYDRLAWDSIAGDMEYSPDVFSFARGSARRGNSSAQLEMSLTLADWSFRPDSEWTFDATLVRTDTNGLRDLLGSSLPLRGVLSGTFHGGGTRANPQIHGLFDLISPEVAGWRLDRARGEFSLDHDAMRITNAELRFLPPPATSGGPAEPAGLLTGDFSYALADRQVSFDLTGAVIPLEGINRIQTPRLHFGGQLSFHLTGGGSLLAPKMDGSLRLVDLRVGDDTIGSFNANVTSDGSSIGLQLDSAMSSGSLHGHLDLSLSGAYPVTGEISIAQLDLDPLIRYALHLPALTGHSSVDGQFSVTGALLQPDTLAVDATISRMAFDYEYVNLQNAGPVQLQYRQSEIRVASAELRGQDTDFHLAGFARFAGDRAVDLRIDGAVNLQLLGAFVPNLDTSGPAQVNASVAGTLSSPRITGRVHVQNASVRYGDFPAGLSQVAGDLVFDTSRMVFDNVSAQIGGGPMQLSGSLTYGQGPVRYDINAQTNQVRIRYPAGMSWLAEGNLRLSGTTQAGTLSGRVTVDRLLMSPGFDISSLLPSTSEGGGGETSGFLQNLQLDVQAVSVPNAPLEWADSTLESDASVVVRGTWLRPILLGNIHFLGGTMNFRGSKYTLSRGDINFVNPFRMDPLINIEATTRIQQYEVTVDFTGPGSHLTMSYRSDPPLPSSDIITLLALGETGEESQLRGTAAVQTPGVGATTLLSEAVSSQLGSRVQRLFGISHFSVGPSLETTSTQSPAARITVAQQFSQDLVVTYSTDVTSTQEEVIQIEYSVRRDISFVALRDENGTFGVDLIFKKRLK
jgi:translocation and assembly module TamB